MQPVTPIVNGTPREVVVEPMQTLLAVLRDQLGLTGTKEGCGTGYCGACTVLVDGQPVNACLYPAVDADRRDVTTIEGLAADGGALHPVQAAFIERFGLQCGYCTPGMILAAASLLAENPQPSAEQTRAALAGNICRCTGYQTIVAAVQDAAARLREQGRSGETPGTRSSIRSRA
ncbi:MAG TPA: (2Fe-2S)-binding protein [Candidatus Eremiobacteraceae bacterium]|nr:(2Fe-2S)-binding protein [Candidatus Eremiobacteraceae bacterium]